MALTKSTQKLPASIEGRIIHSIHTGEHICEDVQECYMYVRLWMWILPSCEMFLGHKITLRDPKSSKPATSETKAQYEAINIEL